ncbi:hypothetical protein ABZ897_20950 [Nonomuraea sp. NPDC046802]|uniref:hypothetical protein n=1 Tax=Nonomuraea sp. NPDC046802 TaxID=3154919 RepID=UPI0033CFF71E
MVTVLRHRGTNPVAVWGRKGWMFVAVVCAAAIGGCGTASIGQTSPDAVTKTVYDIAGLDGKVYGRRVLVENADDGKSRWMSLVVACKREGGCQVVAPDGVGYPNFQAFLNDTKLIKPGDRVLGAANITSPGEPLQAKTFTKRADEPLALYAGFALLVLLVAVWLILQDFRRRRTGADE